MLWEHEPQGSVSIAFTSSPKLSRVFVYLDRNTEYMFSTSLKCLYGQQGFYSYGSSILCKKVF